MDREDERERRSEWQAGTWRRAPLVLIVDITGQFKNTLRQGTQTQIAGGPMSVQSGQWGARFFRSVGLPITIL